MDNGIVVTALDARSLPVKHWAKAHPEAAALGVEAVRQLRAREAEARADSDRVKHHSKASS
jgi:hypothetical protein